MKKYAAIVLAVLLAVSMLCTGVSAEEAGSNESTTTTAAAPSVLSVTLKLDISDEGQVTVTATDSNGAPANGYALSLIVNNMAYTAKTENGKHVSPYTVDAGNSASVEGLRTECGNGVIYEAASMISKDRAAVATTTTTTTGTTTSSDVAADATTTVSGEETTTTSESTTTTTATTTANKESTTATVRGAGTTAAEDGVVAMNVSTDTGLLETFGISRAEFGAAARLLLSEADYTALVGRTNNVPMLNVRGTEPVSAALVQAALAGLSEYASYTEDQRLVVTFDLSLQMISRTGKEVAVTVLPEGVLYTVQLPVPTPLKDCKKFAVTVMDGDALMAPQVLEVKNGMFELQVNSLEPYTIIGFTAGDEGKAGGVSWRLVLLLIAGILLLGGAATLLYFFVFRKPDEAEAQPEEEEEPSSQEDTENEIFSGRTDMDLVWDPEDN